MNQTSTIQLRAERKFGDLMSVTVEYLRLHFRTLFKAILFIAGPPIILGGAIMGTSIGTLIGYATDRTSPPLEYFLPMFGGILVILCAATLMGAVVNEYVILSVERNSAIEISEVWDALRRDIWVIIPTYIGHYVIIVVGMVLLIVPGIWASNVFQFMIPVRIQERLGFGEALSRCMELVRGKWWFTFGFLYVVSLAAGMIGYAFIIPLYLTLLAAGLTGSFTTTPMVVAIAASGLVALVGQFLVNALPQMAITINYFNLVERLDGAGLALRIGAIGQTGSGPQSGHDSPGEQSGFPR